jgi:uncharacterized membrane protein YbhN (UPF0104 family)
MAKTLLKLIVSAVVLIVVIMVTDTTLIIDRLKQANLAWLGVALVCLTALTFLMAKRWQLVAHALGLDLSYGHAVREYYLSQLINLILPGGVVGDATRAVRLRNEGDLLRAAQSVMIERLIGQITLFSLMFLGFIVVLSLPGGVAWPSFTWLVLCLGVLGAVCVVIFGRRKDAFARFLQLTGQLLRQPLQIILSTAIALLISFGFYACAMATGTTLPFSTLFTLIPLILTSMLIPLSVGGWGWREGAAAALFPLAGAAPSAGIATGIAYGAMMLIAALPAVIFIAFPKTNAHIDIQHAENP